MYKTLKIHASHRRIVPPYNRQNRPPPTTATVTPSMSSKHPSPKFNRQKLSTHCIDSPLGPITLAASTLGLCGLWFDEQKHGPTDADKQHWHSDPDHPVLKDCADQLQAYFAGTPVLFNMALDLSSGTPFQQAVWHALRHIPSGQSQSYGGLARQLDNPKAVRAVGSAVGRNPVSIIVPCHRVLGTDGQLTGYAGGQWRKQALLQLEGHPSAKTLF